jgi:hypothetical protein
MNRINARPFAIALLILQTCADISAYLIFAWKHLLPYRISPAQQAAVEAAGIWLDCAFLTALITGGAAVLLLRSPACRAGHLRAWATTATIALILVFVVEVFAPWIHSISRKPPNEPARSLDGTPLLLPLCSAAARQRFLPGDGTFSGTAHANQYRKRANEKTIWRWDSVSATKATQGRKSRLRQTENPIALPAS